ncbi:flagellar export chaperone FliS [Pseudoxanthomonas daejeonensis]|uniref:Flagellar secretion chaperone FliS n=1 Tax=Pseudoxanthomonas daejeonensis TaxID=266062 RepID=A0ABQ6Z678_9GAMM|nr:flagellar export chaperone FliS [Pseudoxanthomonas daejeonensis]KAF1694049.1 flagellar export chaperone FliS [Pseudoxanthomonas daejeonensis]UNK57292.1 flagellar export chaperone FliS [Pseudoxanthomonas daejeonensis]
MYGSSRHFAEQYRKTGVSAKVNEADPHRLISLLFEGAGQRIRRAQACLAQGDPAHKGKAIGEACAIIGHLNGSLDHEAGGEVASNLSALYDYIVRRLIEANLHNDRAALSESLDLLGEIESAWNAIPEAQRAMAVES